MPKRRDLTAFSLEWLLTLGVIDPYLRESAEFVKCPIEAFLKVAKDRSVSGKLELNVCFGRQRLVNARPKQTVERLVKRKRMPTMQKITADPFKRSRNHLFAFYSVVWIPKAFMITFAVCIDLKKTSPIRKET